MDKYLRCFNSLILNPKPLTIPWFPIYKLRFNLLEFIFLGSNGYIFYYINPQHYTRRLCPHLMLDVNFSFTRSWCLGFSLRGSHHFIFLSLIFGSGDRLLVSKCWIRSTWERFFLLFLLVLLVNVSGISGFPKLKNGLSFGEHTGNYHLSFIIYQSDTWVSNLKFGL